MNMNMNLNMNIQGERQTLLLETGVINLQRY